MSSHDSDRDLDDLLREDGGKLGALYRKLPHYEAPRRLDRAILGEAARAVHSGKPPRRQRWLIGVGSAAGLVLAAGMAWRIGHDAMNEGTVAPAAAPIVVPVQPIDGAAHAKREQSAARDAATSEALSPPAPAAQNAAKPVERDAVKQAERKLRAAAKQAPPAPKPAAAPPPEAFPAEPRQREEVTSKDLEKSQSVEESQQPATATGAMGGAAASPVAPASDKKASAAPERARMPASPTVPSGSIELRRDMQLPPGEWLAHIRELDRQGRRQQAMESLRLFIRAHPDRKVPEDLRELLD